MKITITSQGFDKIANKIELASEKAAHALAVQVERDTEPFAPAQTKSMVNRVQVDGGTIIYPGPYARYLYYGKLMVDPKTGSAWAPMGASKTITGTDLNISRAVHGKAQSHWFEASKAMNKDKWLRSAKKLMDDELK